MNTDSSQLQRAQAFRALHEAHGIFVIPNPWDVGSARLLAGQGFSALASTSAGCAFAQGRPDHSLNRAATLEHVRALAAATPLPLSVDLEGGYGDSPETVAETITLAAQAGAVGASIEDIGPDGKPYPLSFATERIHAAVEAAGALPFPFMLTARADNYFIDQLNLADTIARLQAYQAAGANVLFAPGLRQREEITAVMGAVERPLNVLLGMTGVDISVNELAALGVKRVSLGGSLARAAYGALLRAAGELRHSGTSHYASSAVPGRELHACFQQYTA
jgi:2-methylisocitrate lyase-like PEP mutase family enzyme